MDNKELLKRSKDTTDYTKEETMWCGPICDILMVIRNTEKSPAVIWELVQNARDVS